MMLLIAAVALSSVSESQLKATASLTAQHPPDVCTTTSPVAVCGGGRGGAWVGVGGVGGGGGGGEINRICWKELPLYSAGISRTVRGYMKAVWGGGGWLYEV
jgi:hypothetical protein